jgi:alginate O-acetyltransferase complex protein AlgI
MLFNSYSFILVFLPVTLAGYYLIGARGHHRLAISWLVAASMFFYAWWNPAYLALMMASILFNYAIGVALGESRRDAGPVSGRLMLAFGVAANLALLGYFKYANFLVDNINSLTGADFHLQRIILPLAISFFTFQQIAYLVDAWRGETREYNFLHYCLFVTFFPQLIAGPIVHHKEMLPQFARDLVYRFSHEHLAIGVSIFTLGLFKKVMLADNIALYATPVFHAAEAGTALTFFDAWSGTLAYTLQIYFDFSGYSDMAIGIARMFGILLPLNFSSPYKARNIIEFWRSWHITLSRFLRDYLYIPLGGNRMGRSRRYVNLMLTMLLGGLWHGAGWTFVIWGALHGMYLAINHAWHAMHRALGGNVDRVTRTGTIGSTLLTFIAVMVGWVFFRAESFQGAMTMLHAMSGGNGVSLPESTQPALSFVAAWFPAGSVSFDGAFSKELADSRHGLPLFSVLLLIVFFAPNTQQIMYRYRPVVEACTGQLSRWRGMSFDIIGQRRFALMFAFAACVSLMYMSHVSEFLYFQF